MKRYAISDLHLGHAVNRAALERLPERPDDWLILAGDVGETAAHANFALDINECLREIYLEGPA